MIQAWFDGVCEPKNPGGHGAYGIWVKFSGIGGDDHRKGHYVGQGDKISNNVAEYEGFIHILNFLKAANMCNRGIIVRGDSKLVIEQMSDRWNIRQGIYVPYAYEARKLMESFTNIHLRWIPRDENEVCDKLAKDVLRNMNIKFKLQPE